MNKIKAKIKTFDPFNNDFVTVISLKEKFVTDGISDSYKNWSFCNPVFISAQTGSGKNTFIEETLIKHAINEGKKMLIISNRFATNRQSKSRICNIVSSTHHLDEYTQKGIDKLESFGNVRIMTYQKLGNYLCDALEFARLEHFHLVVFDECHFFMSDSLFNNKTNIILEKCLRKFNKSVRIYMTATPEEVFPILLHKEIPNASITYVNSCDYFTQNLYPGVYYKKPLEFLFYKFKRNYDYVQPKFFYDDIELIERVKNTPQDEKWIIFVSSKDAGFKLKESLGTDAVFITSESKSSKKDDGLAYDELINEEKSHYRVIISTTALDNGINIKDHALKNIALFSVSKSEFLQMLGRKRIENNEKLSLYLCARSSKYFSSKLFTTISQIQFYYKLINSPSEFINTLIEKRNDVISGLFYIDKNMQPVINTLAIKKIFDNKAFYEEMNNNLLTDKNAFIKEQLKWIDKTFNDNMYINFRELSTQDSKVIELILSYSNKPLDTDEFIDFATKFKNTITEIYGKQPGDRSDRAAYGIPKIRKIIANYNLNFNLVNKNGLTTIYKM